MGPEGPGIGPPDTTLPLLLPPASRTSQWSEVDELVEPEKKKEKERMQFVFFARQLIQKQATCSHRHVQRNSPQGFPQQHPMASQASQ